MKKLALRIFALALFLAASGCYRIRYEIGAPSPRGTYYTDSRWNNYFVFGFIPSQSQYTFDNLCHGDEVKEIRSYRSAQNVLATVFSLGLSAGSTVEVSCHQPSK